MDFSSLLKELKLDSWYKALMYVGGIALLMAFFVDVKGIANAQLQLLASGLFFVGLGEWKNHKVRSWIKPPNAYTGGAAIMSETLRQPDKLGLFFDGIGITLLVLGLANILYSLLAPGSTLMVSPLPTASP